MATDPLNLMRVMPPKEARGPNRTGDSAMRFSAHRFYFESRTSNSVIPSRADDEGPRTNPPRFLHQMIAPINSEELQSSDSLPNSRKVYVNGERHPDLRVPFREIRLAPTKTMSGEIEVNEPVRVYDTSGPWGDASLTLDPVQGLPALRAKWIRSRRDVEEITGRAVTPIDDGYLSISHAESSVKRNGNAEF
jgi:hypothetical protein